MDKKLEELAPNPYASAIAECELKGWSLMGVELKGWSLAGVDRATLRQAEKGLEWDAASRTQRAFMLSQGYVRLPSEGTLAEWLVGHLNYTSRGLAQELRRLLREKP